MRDTMDRSTFDRSESAARSYCRRFDVVFDTAQGSVMVDVAGERYLDFLAGAGSLNYGHNDPDMCDALMAYVKRCGIAHSLDLHTQEKQRFIETFRSHVLTPRGLDYRVQFTGPTGTNAIEAALKLARKATGRSNVIAFTNGFHGVTQGALAATGNQHHRKASSHLLSGVTRAPFDGYCGSDLDTAALLDKLLEDPSSGVDPPAAVLLETVQGEGGLNVASNAWLRRVAATARSHGAMLIIDDIQAGCGRTGTFFSFESAGVEPDVVVLSKSLSGAGLPMAVVLIRPDRDVWAPGEHNGTFRGPNHSFVTATVALEKFWGDTTFAVDIERRSMLLRSALDAVATRANGVTVVGRGMMQGLDVGDGRLASEICDRCFAAGLLLETSGAQDQVVKVMAPLTTPDDQLCVGLEILASAVSDVVRPVGVTA